MSAIHTRQPSPAHARRTVAAVAALAVAAALLATAPLGSTPTADAADGDQLGTKIIKTFAGTGEGGFGGDGGPATQAQVDGPRDVALDGEGNVYVADTRNYRVRKIASDGTITTVAGSGESGFSGDGGPATEAELSRVYGLAADDAGNVYLADALNHRVRKVGPDGTITTIAGSGDTGWGGGGFSGDGGPATEANLDTPTGLALDDADNLYIADNDNHRIRKIDSSGTIATVAGSSDPTERRGAFSGDDGPATEAELNNPRDVALDDAGNLYIVDDYNLRVRKVDSDGIITTVAGTGGDCRDQNPEYPQCGEDGPATEADMRPGRLAVDSSGALYFSSYYTGVIRRVDPSGIITTVAGTGKWGGYAELVDEVPPLDAELGGASGLAIDEEIGPESQTRGLLLADAGLDTVRQIVRMPDLLEATMSASDPFNVGEDPAYTVEVINKGLAGTATGVTLTDELAERLEFVSAEATQGSCSETDGTVTCALGELAPGDTATVTLTVAPAKPGIVVANTALVSANENDPFPYDNNSPTVQTPVGDTGCGQVVTEDLTLSEDVGPCPFDGLVAGADDVTIDLGSHHLSGFRAFTDDYLAYDFLDADNKAGIRLAGRSGVTVENGTVSGFSAGVVVAHGGENTVAELTLRDNLGPTAGTSFPLPDLGDGIFVINSPSNRIVDNTLVGNGVFDSIGVYGPDSDNTEVKGNLVEDTLGFFGTPHSSGDGIIINGADRQQGTISDSVVANNTVRGSGGAGMANLNHVDSKIVNNLVENNGLSQYNPHGIGVRMGRELEESRLYIAGNEVRDNHQMGLRIDADGNTITNNTALGNSHGIALMGATGNEVTNNTGDENKFNDLLDYSRDPETGEFNCYGNTWQNNHWGSGGYFPECTTNRGQGPKPNRGEGLDDEELQIRERPQRQAPPASQGS